MKYIYKIIIIAVALIVGSCHSDLDVNPETSLSQQDLDRLNEENIGKMLEGQIATMHSSMLNAANAGDHFSFGQNGVNMIFSFMGNDLCMHTAGYIGWFDYTIGYRGESYVRAAFFWRLFYKYIANANDLLRELPKDETTFTTTLKIAKATALTFRGFSYFYLANVYQFPYSDENKNLPGVPIVTDAMKKGEDQPRSTLEQTYQQAISDLTTAQQIFIDAGVPKRGSTQMDAMTCALYLTRAYQAMGNFVEAEKQADLVIANYPVLTGRTQLWHGFNDVKMPNVVLGFENKIQTRMTFASNFAQYDVYSKAAYATNIPKIAFSGLLRHIDKDDDRFFWWTSAAASNALGEGPGGVAMLRDTPYRMANMTVHPADTPAYEYISVKFIGTGRDAILADPLLRDNYGTLNWDLGDNIYLRSEEAYLVKAEALAQQNKLTEAKRALEDFVKTRNATYTCIATSKQGLIDEIQIHKRIEFWCEGIEYLDNRRLGVPIDRRDKPEYVSNHTAGAKFYLPANDKDFVFQIPLTEIQTNAEIGPDNQNP